ncbi:unnamed protein product [Closterium sp. NIES-65]|nr:unnamed protein product [Closterium sp. NIES-65]
MFHGPTHSHGKVREDEKVVRGSERTGIMCDPRLSLRTLLVPLPRPPLRFPRPPVRQWGMPTDLAAVALLAQATFEATQKSHGSRGSTGAGGGRLSIQRGGLQLRDTVNAVIRQRRFNEAIMCLRPQRQSSSPLISSLFRPLSRLSHPLPPSPALSSPLPPSSPSPPISPPFPPLFPSLPPTQAEAVQRGNNVSAPAAALLPAAGRNEGWQLHRPLPLSLPLPIPHFISLSFPSPPSLPLSLPLLLSLSLSLSCLLALPPSPLKTLWLPSTRISCAHRTAAR